MKYLVIFAFAAGIESHRGQVKSNILLIGVAGVARLQETRKNQNACESSYANWQYRRFEFPVARNRLNPHSAQLKSGTVAGHLKLDGPLPHPTH